MEGVKGKLADIEIRASVENKKVLPCLGGCVDKADR